MKHLTFIICAVIFSVTLIGCAGNRAQINARQQQQRKKQTPAETQKAETERLAKAPVPTTVVSRQGKSRMERDSSVIETLYDAFGNKVESRTFRDDPLLQMVVLKTAADGQKQAFIYGTSGDIKIAPDTALDKVLVSAAGEIAKSVEIYEGRRSDEVAAKLPTAEPNQINNFTPTVNFVVPTAQENTTVTESKPTEIAVKTPAKKTETQKSGSKTVKIEDAASKLRADLLNFKPNRARVPLKN